ncbi:MAG: outer membrane protein assembly factor BamC [Congregibacter sp.]
MRAQALHWLMLPALASLTGCGYLFGDSGVFRDTTNDYREAAEAPLIALPGELSSDNLDEIYAIPAIQSEPQFGKSDRVPRPAPLVAASADQLVRIQKLADESWALIAIAPGQLWPQLRSFLSAAGVTVARMDAREGIIESTYLDLKEQTQASRFRFRVERGVQRGNSELHVLQMHQATDDSWPAQSDDLELESDMLRGVAQFIANSADTAPVSMMAEQSISATGKVALEDDDQGPFIRLDLPFARAWASLSRSLEMSGFEITDRNRSDGLYYVTYRGEDDEDKSGWFGWLSGGEDEHPAQGMPLLLSVRSVETERMHLRLSSEGTGEDLELEALQSLLVLIKGNIN